MFAAIWKTIHSCVGYLQHVENLWISVVAAALWDEHLCLLVCLVFAPRRSKTVSRACNCLEPFAFPRFLFRPSAICIASCSRSVPETTCLQSCYRQQAGLETRLGSSQILTMLKSTGWEAPWVRCLVMKLTTVDKFSNKVRRATGTSMSFPCSSLGLGVL